MGKISTNPKSIEARERKANQAAEAKAAKEKAREDAFWKDDDKSKVGTFSYTVVTENMATRNFREIGSSKATPCLICKFSNFESNKAIFYRDIRLFD